MLKLPLSYTSILSSKKIDHEILASYCVACFLLLTGKLICASLEFLMFILKSSGVI